MGYNIRDLERAAKDINQRLEERSQERGRELAGRVLSRTSEGRGLWFIILWPAWFLIFVFSGVFLTHVIQVMGVTPPVSWAGYLGGVLFARAWYRSNFTIRHPFLGSVLGYLGTAMVVVFLAEKFGFSI